MANHILFTIFICQFLLSSASAHSTSTLRRSRHALLSHSGSIQQTSSSLPSPSSTTIFEVRRPINVPKTPACSTLVLRHNFANTYNKPPATAIYFPPSHCSGVPTRIVLEWSASCSGIQYDRIFGVWLGGIELLRSCTAEPLPSGVTWSVRKEVTRYASLFSKPNTLSVYLGNIVNQNYTGVYHANISFHFYYDTPKQSASSFNTPADLIFPISKTLPLSDGLWFQIENSKDIQGKKVTIPRNTYRAVLEVYLSFHSRDEFWYTNPPNSYIYRNNLTGVPGNGAFREVTVKLDDRLIGTIWPFTVIYTGGINPLLWSPISGIGSFDLPSYDIEITPFLGEILDGKSHFFGFGVTNGLDSWFIDANLHLWIDSKSQFTRGGLISHQVPPFSPSLISKFKGGGLDASFDTRASRRISSYGWVESSHGNMTTYFYQDLNFFNKMLFAGKDGNTQTVNQNIDYKHGIIVKNPILLVHSEQVLQSFPLNLNTGAEDEKKDSYTLNTKISLGFNEKTVSGAKFGFTVSDLKNSQTGKGFMRVKGDRITGMGARMDQVYSYSGRDDGCYYRKVGSANHTILYDETKFYCS